MSHPQPAKRSSVIHLELIAFHDDIDPNARLRIGAGILLNDLDFVVLNTRDDGNMAIRISQVTVENNEPSPIESVTPSMKRFFFFLLLLTANAASAQIDPTEAPACLICPERDNCYTQGEMSDCGFRLDSFTVDNVGFSEDQLPRLMVIAETDTSLVIEVQLHTSYCNVPLNPSLIIDSRGVLHIHFPTVGPMCQAVNYYRVRMQLSRNKKAVRIRRISFADEIVKL